MARLDRRFKSNRKTPLYDVTNYRAHIVEAMFTYQPMKGRKDRERAEEVVERCCEHDVYWDVLRHDSNTVLFFKTEEDLTMFKLAW